MIVKVVSTLAIAWLAVSPAYAAADFPTKEITLVVPYPPGGSTDATARLMAEQMGKVLGQSVVVENRAGAAGNIGANYVARAKAVGYPRLLSPSWLLANTAVYKSRTCDLIKDVEPVSRIARIPNVLVVGANSKANSLDEFIELARAANPPLTYASAGSGTGQHLAGALFSNK